MPAVAVAAALFLALSAPALCAAPVPNAAPVLSVSALSRGDVVVADLILRWEYPQEVVDSLLGGLESRLVFTVRLYERRRGVFSILGDRVVARAAVVRRAYRDILTQRFIVDQEGGPTTSYATTGDVLTAFLAVDGLTLRHLSSGRPVYVAARALLEPMRLMPPLTLVTLAGEAAYATPWVRSEAP